MVTILPKNYNKYWKRHLNDKESVIPEHIDKNILDH